MLPNPKSEQLSDSEVINPSPTIQIMVDDSLNGAIFSCKESRKKAGEIVFLEISGVVPNQPKGYEVHIKSSTPKEIFGGTIRESHKSDQKGNTFNTTFKKEGVFMENPNDKIRLHALAFFSPLKISLASIYAGVVWVFSTPPFSQVGYFTVIAFLEALLVIFPRVHSKGKDRFSTLYLRFLQWAGAIVFGAGLLAMETLAKISDASGLMGTVAKGVFSLGMGFLIAIYFFRLFGSAYKLYYGEKADKMRRKTLSLFPEKLRKFVGDKDIMG